MGNSFIDYFHDMQTRNMMHGCIHSCPELMECIQQLGFLPLLDSGIPGFCAEEMMAPECRFTRFNDGSWEWPLWEWKSAVVTEGRCVYGKFFSGKAGFVSRRRDAGKETGATSQAGRMVQRRPETLFSKISFILPAPPSR